MNSIKLILVFLIILHVASTQAGVILTPISATASSTSASSIFISADNTINQSGLNTPYISGVDDFDTYIASGPKHGNSTSWEWWSEQNNTSATITFDMGAAYSLDRFALWHEEGAGFTTANILGSLDGSNFVNLVTINPTDVQTTPGVFPSFLPEVFDLNGGNAVSAQFIRFDMSGCAQQPYTGTYNHCAMGEIAFSQASISAPVPEPASLSLFTLGLATIFLGRRKKQQK